MTIAKKIAYPKTRLRRALAALGGAAILLLLAVCFCAVCGDPITRAYSQRHAVDFANEQWPGHDFAATGIEGGAGFRYTVNVQSAVSVDTNFNVYVQCGIVRSTDYAVWGGTLRAAERRIRWEIEADVRAALADAGLDWLNFEVCLTADDAHPCPEGRSGVEVDMPYDKTDLPFASVEFYNRAEDPDVTFTQQEADDWLAQAMEALRAAQIDVTYCQLRLFWGGGMSAPPQEVVAGPCLMEAGEAPPAE